MKNWHQLPNTKEEFSDNFRREKNSCDMFFVCFLRVAKNWYQFLTPVKNWHQIPNTKEEFSDNF